MRTDDDAAAFTALFEQHRHGVHAFLLAKTSDPEAATDLLQETFLRLWRRLDEVGRLDDGPQRAWIFTVARNLVIDRYRSEATRRTTAEAVARDTDPGGGRQPDAADQVHARGQLERLEAAIGRLPEDQRVILSLATMGEMTSQQVGEALDLPPGTVRYKLRQARTRLADDLGGTR